MNWNDGFDAGWDAGFNWGRGRVATLLDKTMSYGFPLVAILGTIIAIACLTYDAAYPGPCRDGVPDTGDRCRDDARLVVEDRVAVCRCEVAK